MKTKLICSYHQIIIWSTHAVIDIIHSGGLINWLLSSYFAFILFLSPIISQQPSTVTHYVEDKDWNINWTGHHLFFCWPSNGNQFSGHANEGGRRVLSIKIKKYFSTKPPEKMRDLYNKLPMKHKTVSRCFVWNDICSKHINLNFIICCVYTTN